jgi:hypothetical protein
VVPRRLVITASVLLLIGGCGLALAEQGGPLPYRLPTAWPFKTLQLGLVDEQGGAPALHLSAPFGLRYHYLSGGANTPQDWTGWATGKGSFVPGYVDESAASGLVPVFSYYQLRQSLPGAKIADEATADITNLHNRATMRAYFENLQSLFTLLHSAAARTVVVHVEPDLWGYIEQRVGDDASREPAMVASTGLPLLRGLPNNVSGLARAVLRMRDRLAPHVLLAYHLSVFGTSKDLHTSALTDQQTDAIAARSVNFYRSLGAHFDMIFAEFTNSDAGYQQTVLGELNPFWGPVDYARQVRFLSDWRNAVGLPFVLWQVPVGNTVYRTDNNTPGHYQDNRAQWLLGSAAAQHLRAYARAGVIALLFGSGVPAGTCACDARRDGVTNPPPIDGNTKVSTSLDDDGGYLVERAGAYYRTRGIRISY